MSSARIVAPRFFACSSSSTTTTPAPSPMTKPSRPVSKGREAADGSSLRVLRAFIFPNPARPIGRIAASEPPAMKASASPNLIIRHASPMLWLAVAQAVTIAMFGPPNPCSIEKTPLAILEIIIGMVKGETRLGLRLRRRVWFFSRVPRPPIPLPSITPTRSRSISLLASPDSVSAIWAAAIERCA